MERDWRDDQPLPASNSFKLANDYDDGIEKPANAHHWWKILIFNTIKKWLLLLLSSYDYDMNCDRNGYIMHMREHTIKCDDDDDDEEK